MFELERKKSVSFLSALRSIWKEFSEVVLRCTSLAPYVLYHCPLLAGSTVLLLLLTGGIFLLARLP